LARHFLSLRWWARHNGGALNARCCLTALVQYAAGPAWRCWQRRSQNAITTIGKCRHAAECGLARQDSLHQRVETPGPWPPHGPAAQRRWRRARRLGQAWRRTPGRLRLSNRLLSLLATSAQPERLHLVSKTNFDQCMVRLRSPLQASSARRAGAGPFSRALRTVQRSLSSSASKYCSRPPDKSAMGKPSR
jgi:hypothetical protein